MLQDEAALTERLGRAFTRIEGEAARLADAESRLRGLDAVVQASVAELDELLAAPGR